MAHTGRGFGCLHEHGAGLNLEGFAHLFKIEGLAVRRADHIHVAPKGFGEAYPTLAELACGKHQHAIPRRSQVRDRGFHRSGTGGGEQNDVVFGSHKGLQIAQHLGVQSAEFRGAVVDIGCGHGELGCRQKRRRAGSKERVLRIMACLSVIKLSPLEAYEPGREDSRGYGQRP